MVRLFYENDDDPQRKLGADSKLTFVAPADGEYLAKITDVRGFGGDKFSYQLAIRPPKPDFSIAVGGKNPKVSPGSGKELSFTSTRMDGYQGEIEIGITGLPPGFSASTPVTIQAEQERAYAVLRAAADAKAPTEAQWKAVKITAKAKIRGKEISKPIGDLGKIELGKPAKVFVQIHPDKSTNSGKARRGWRAGISRETR